MAKRKKRSAKTRQPRPATLRTINVHTQSDTCTKASLILQTSHESAAALLKAFDLARAERGRPRGMTTDEEQDLLRAMLVMAAAGLDGMIKQIIRDALPLLVQIDERSLDALEKFVTRQFKVDLTGPGAATSHKFLGRVLSRPDPQGQVVEEYIVYLTRGSLQSAAALYETAAALGLWPDDVGVDRDKLQPIFDVRNKIIHELDINLEAARRNRNIRSLTSMIRDTNALMRVAEQILREVDKKVVVQP